MASGGVATCKGVASCSGFFTPASSASLVDEFENHPSSVRTPSHSIVFPHSQCTLSSQGRAKDLLSSSNRSQTLQLAQDAVFSTKEVEVCFGDRQPHPVPTQYDTGMLLSTVPADMCSVVCTRHAFTKRGAPSPCTPSIVVCTPGAVEGQGQCGASIIDEIPRGSLPVVKVKRDTKPKRSKEEETSSVIIQAEPSTMALLLKISTKNQTGQDCKDMGVSDVARPMEDPRTAAPSTDISKEHPPTWPGISTDISTDAIDRGSWIPHQISRFTHAEGFCSGSSAVQFPGSSSQDLASARSTSAHSEAATLLCRLVKCVSAASAMCTVNNESLHDEGLERRHDPLRCPHLQQPRPGNGCCAAEVIECKAGSGPRLQVQPLPGGQSESCAGKPCEDPFKNKESTDPVELHLAIGLSSTSGLPSRLPTTTAGSTIDATKIALRQVSLRWSAVSPVQLEASAVFPIRKNHDRPSLREATQQDIDRKACFGTFCKRERKTQLFSRTTSVPCGHRGGLHSGENCASDSADHTGSSVSTLQCSTTSDTRYETDHSRTLAFYAGCAENNICGDAEPEGTAALRIHSTPKNIQCVLKPSFPAAFTQLFTEGHVSVKPDHKQNRETRRIWAARHRHSSHSRKARRCTEYAECVSSSTLETSALAAAGICSRLASTAVCVVRDHPFQGPPVPDVLTPWDRGTTSDSSGTEAASTWQQQATNPRSANDLLRVSERSSKPSTCIPMKGEEVVKNYGDDLSTFERLEILDYEEVWYWGSRRVTPPDEVQKSSEKNFGFDDARGDYRAILGDHICYRFEVMTPLGRGSFGQVFRAFDHKKQEQVALKILRNKNHFHVQGRVEIRVLQELVHHDPENKANVVHMKEHFLFRNHLVITFELLSVNVYDFLKQNSFKGLSSLAVRSIAIQLLQALRLLRKQRIVHCDLKPENIVLKNVHKSGIKVVDFGSSCREGEMPYSYIQSRFYRSPEVILGLTYNCAIDMWSLGCVLAELQTGQPLFPGENEADQINCIMEVLGPPPDYLISESPKRELFFKDSGEPKLSTSSKGNKRKILSRDFPSVLRTDDLHFVEFIRGCLQWDPARRITPDEAMQHEWIKEFKALRQRKHLSLT